MCESRDEPDHTCRTSPRQAKLGQYRGTAVGVCIFLSVSDLHNLNINPDIHQAVEYKVRDFGPSRGVEVSGTNPTEVNALPDSTDD